MLPILPIDYSEDWVGKTMGMSKRKYIWKFRDTVKDTEHTVILTSSFVTGKKKLYFDDILQTEQQVFLNGNFNYSWPASNLLLSIVPYGEKFMLTIDGISYRRIEKHYAVARSQQFQAQKACKQQRAAESASNVRTSHGALPLGAPENRAPHGSPPVRQSATDQASTAHTGEQEAELRAAKLAQSERDIEYENMRRKVAEIEAREARSAHDCGDPDKASLGDRLQRGSIEEKPKRKKEKKHKRSSKSSASEHAKPLPLADEANNIPDLLDFESDIFGPGFSSMPLQTSNGNENASSSASRRLESNMPMKPSCGVAASTIADEHMLEAILSPVTAGAPASFFAPSNTPPLVFGTLVSDHDPALPLVESSRVFSNDVQWPVSLDTRPNVFAGIAEDNYTLSPPACIPSTERGSVHQGIFEASPNTYMHTFTDMNCTQNK